MPIISQGEKSIYSDTITSLGAFALDPPSPSIMSDSFSDAAGSKLKAVAIGRVTKEAAKVLGPLGFLASFVADKMGDHMKEKQENAAALKGIEELSKRNIPGMIFKQTNIDGDQYRIGIDASARMSDASAEARIIVERQDTGFPQMDNVNSYRQNSGINLKDPALAAQVNAIKNASDASIEAYKQEVAINLPAEKKKYREEMLKHLEEIDEADADKVGSLVAPTNPLGAEVRYSMLLYDRAYEIRTELMDKAMHKAPVLQQKTPAPEAAFN